MSPIKSMLVFGMLSLLSTADAMADFPAESRRLDWIDMNSYQIPLEINPEWDFQTPRGTKGLQFIAISPDAYYPPTTIISQHFVDEKVPNDIGQFKAFASATASIAAKNYGYAEQLDDLTAFNIGQLEGYQVQVPGKVEGKNHDVLFYIAKTPDQSVFVLTVLTLQNKMSHALPVVDRTRKNIRFEQENPGLEKY